MRPATLISDNAIQTHHLRQRSLICSDDTNMYHDWRKRIACQMIEEELVDK